MIWRARYQGPNGIDAALEATDWDKGMDLLRGLLEAARPERGYLEIVDAFRRASPEIQFVQEVGRHRFTMLPVGECVPVAQMDLFTEPRATAGSVAR